LDWAFKSLERDEEYMTDEIARIVDQVFRLVYIVRNVAYYRSLDPFKDDLEQNYWIHIFNNFLDIAVLEWCKVFGSKNDATHWSNHVDDVEIFRSGMIAKLGVSEEEWSGYWESIKNYRDTVVAHHERSSKASYYPDMHHALTACFYYYEILIKKLRALRIEDYPNNLQEYFENSLKQAKTFSNIAYTATTELKEQVY
jgi:hypothetical protein